VLYLDETFRRLEERAMCYSAMVKQSLKKLGLQYYARVQIDLFEDLYKRRSVGEKLKLPRALDFNFTEDSDQKTGGIRKSIEKYRATTIQELEEDLFAQKKRLADAERKLETKPTKTAEKEKGIAERKIVANKRRLEKLKSDEVRPEDSRIFAMDYAPVIVLENGERVIKPMRYLCRPDGFPESFDREYPGCYNARRDSLKKFWKNQYLRNHGILIITSFFENVAKHDYERRKLKKGEEPENMVLEFQANGFDEMIIPVIWDRWQSKGSPDLYSFALITDEPPQEVSEAGHDRCPIFLKPENIDAWLDPCHSTEKKINDLLDDKETPIYSNRKIA
jgi:putative SOS response-associated peptidase YedK